ncbi:MAG: hypothetical protein WA858_02430, partial [Xanthobacteraceae bacterium]
MIPRRSNRIDPGLVLGLALVAALPLGANWVAFAQNAPSQAPAGVTQMPANHGPASHSPSPSAAAAPAAPPQADAETLKKRDQELDTVRAQERASAENQA